VNGENLYFIYPKKIRDLGIDAEGVRKNGIGIPKYGFISNSRFSRILDESSRLKAVKAENALVEAKFNIKMAESISDYAGSGKFFTSIKKMKYLIAAENFYSKINEIMASFVGHENQLSLIEARINAQNSEMKQRMGYEQFAWVRKKAVCPDARMTD
jgi:hypothetical protein